MRKRRADPAPDDGLVGFRCGPVEPWVVEANSHAHMAGFDTLPRSVRDAINYAETPEEGALPARDLAGPGGPFFQMVNEAPIVELMVEQEIKRMMAERGSIA